MLDASVPTIALVGRPACGKSSLRDALSASMTNTAFEEHSDGALDELPRRAILFVYDLTSELSFRFAADALADYAAAAPDSVGR